MPATLSFPYHSVYAEFIVTIWHPITRIHLIESEHYATPIDHSFGKNAASLISLSKHACENDQFFISDNVEDDLLYQFWRWSIDVICVRIVAAGELFRLSRLFYQLFGEMGGIVAHLEVEHFLFTLLTF